MNLRIKLLTLITLLALFGCTDSKKDSEDESNNNPTTETREKSHTNNYKSENIKMTMTKEQYDKKVAELSKLEDAKFSTYQEGRTQLEKFISELTKLEQELGSQLDELLKDNDGEETDESDEVEERFIETSEWLGESMDALSEWPEDK